MPGPVPQQAAAPAEADKGAVIVLLYVAAVIIPIGFDVGTLAMNGLRLLLLFTIVPTTIGLFTGRYGKVYPVDYLLFFHAFWAVVSISINNPDRVVENAGAYSLEFLGGYAIGRAYIRTPQAFYRLIRISLAFVILSLPFALIESQTGTAVIVDLIERVPGLKTVQQIDVAKRMGLHRSQVVFAHPIHYGLFCTMVLSMTWIGMKGVMSGTARILGVMAVGLGVFLSLSSGALLAALLQGGLIAWNFIFRSNPRRWWVLVGLFAFAYVVVDLLSNRSPVRVFMSYATFSAHNAFYRAIIFEWGMMNVWDNPITGLGLRRWIRPSFMRSGSIDNFWLVAAVKFGFPGFLSLAGAYLDAMVRIGRRRFTPGSPVSNLRLAWMFTTFGLIFSLATVHIWTSIFSFVFFLLGAGMWFVNASDEPAAVANGAVEPASDAPRRAGPALRRENSTVTHTRSTSESDVSERTASLLSRKGSNEEAARDEPELRYTRFSDGPAPDADAPRRGRKR